MNVIYGACSMASMACGARYVADDGMGGAAPANWPTMVLVCRTRVSQVKGRPRKSKDAGNKRRRATAGAAARRPRAPSPSTAASPASPGASAASAIFWRASFSSRHRCAARPRRSRAALTPACRATVSFDVWTAGRRRPSSAAGRAAASFFARRPRSARHAPGARGPLGLVAEAPARSGAAAASPTTRPRRA